MTLLRMTRLYYNGRAPRASFSQHGCPACVILSKRRSLAPNPKGGMRPAPCRDLVPSSVRRSDAPFSTLKKQKRMRNKFIFTPFSAEIPPSLSLGAAYAVRLRAAVTRAPLRMTRRGGTRHKRLCHPEQETKSRAEPHRGDAERTSASGSRPLFGTLVKRKKSTELSLRALHFYFCP